MIQNLRITDSWLLLFDAPDDCLPPHEKLPNEPDYHLVPIESAAQYANNSRNGSFLSAIPAKRLEYCIDPGGVSTSVIPDLGKNPRSLFRVANERSFGTEWTEYYVDQDNIPNYLKIGRAHV